MYVCVFVKISLYIIVVEAEEGKSVCYSHGMEHFRLNKAWYNFSTPQTKRPTSTEFSCLDIIIRLGNSI